MGKLLSFSNLVELGVVSNWTQLGRLQKEHHFPRGFLLSPNARRWREDEVEAWLASRAESCGAPELDLTIAGEEGRDSSARP